MKDSELLTKRFEKNIAGVLRGQGLHWSIYQAEWATDVVFKSSRILPVLYEELVRTAAIEIKCADSYGFLGSVKDDKQRSYRGVNFFQIGQKSTCSSSAIKRTSYFAHYGYLINHAQT